MKRILILFTVSMVIMACKKEGISEKNSEKPVVIQLEVVNSAGQSTFYLQQVVK